MIVALGATAARAVLGRAIPILAQRGTLMNSLEGNASMMQVLVTVHPSYLLRVPPESRDTEYQKFVDDLRIASKYIRDRR
ncbi:MAG: uracil-DNA glycosylase family protein [Burkholderiaceae bacterium]